MRIGKLVAAAGAVAILGFGAMAPAIAQQAPGPARGANVRRPMVARWTFLLGRLNLTEAQKAQVKGFVQDAQAQATDVRDDTSLTPEQRRAKVQVIEKTLRANIFGILTPPQQEQLKRLLRGAQVQVFRRWAFVLSKLNLTDTQKAQVKGFMQNAEAKASIIREDENLTPPQKRTKMQAIEKMLRESIIGILTPLQKDKLKELWIQPTPRLGSL